jgi:predicted O-linked N-acetylglucosamine transferase (SPINDLY family)
VLLGNLCQTLNYVVEEPGGEALACRRRFGALLNPAPPVRPGQCPHAPDPARRLRIGYLSPDFKDHAVMRFLEPVLEHHDRAAFDVFCYHTGSAVDETTRRIQASPLTWRHIPQIADAQLLAMLRNDALDILVELSGHTSGHRLGVLARRAAPVQATYIGCPSSTGLTTIDYRVVDGITDPPGADTEAAERLERLPGCFLCYRPPEGGPGAADARRNAGGERPITFGSFNNLAKLSAKSVGLFAGALGAAPGSKLLLKGKALGEASVQSTIRDGFAGTGVRPDRLEFLPEQAEFAEHLACYGRVDIALDTTPYNGTTTTCEALWMGVPVVTLAGHVHASRVGASLLSAAGCAEWVAQTPDQFAAIAASLAKPRGPDERAVLRDRLRASRLCDAVAHTRELEAVYRRMWTAWCATA